MKATATATPATVRAAMSERSTKDLVLVITVAALGYFVDIYDLLLFTIVRTSSLRGIGVPDADLLSTGVMLLNMQMAGMLVGGILWGVLGDKRGRLSVLFGSIITYSVANIANGFVSSVGAYAVLRLLAGIGLSGELGAGITLVSESMSKEKRGYGTTIVAAVGFVGAVVAVLVGGVFSWRTAYFVGGGMGLCLLAARIGVFESGAFTDMKEKAVRRGDFVSLFRSGRQLKKYASVILSGLPTWFVIAILLTFSPEIGAAMGLTPAPVAGRAVFFCYLGASLGGLASGALSQIYRTRKKVLLAFILMTGVFIALHFVAGRASLTWFYTICGLLGFAVGYWALFISMAAEQFGTNVRATVTTTAPNFVRGAVVPITLLFQALTLSIGIQASALIVGLGTVVVAVLAVANLDETYGKDLNFFES